MTKEIRRYELALDTDEEEAGLMKAQMRIEEAQRIRREHEKGAIPGSVAQQANRQHHMR